MDVEEAMTQPTVACRADDPVREAVRLMRERDLSFLPVLDPQQGRCVVGVVTARDLCRLSRGREPASVAGRPLREVMSDPIHVCWPEDSLESAEAIMRAHRVRRLPVVAPSGDLVGVVSLADIARVAARPPPRAETPPRVSEVVETLGTLAAAHDPGTL